MAKKTPLALTHPADWTISTEITANGRKITPGTELTIIGQKGRFRFIRHVKTPTAEWIDVAGGKHNHWRAFNTDKIKTVHRIKKTRGNT